MKRQLNVEGLLSLSVRTVLPVCLCAVLGVTAASCAHPQAKAVVELPPMDMPPAPPRIVEVNEPTQPPLVSLPDDPAINLRPRPVPAQGQETPRRPAEPPKVEQATAEPPKPTEEAPKPTNPTTLQTTPTQREAEVERRIRTLVARATSDLSRVDYQALNAEARNQYDTAKRFALQAEDALRSRNLVFASNLADKAAALAAQLLGR